MKSIGNISASERFGNAQDTVDQPACRAVSLYGATLEYGLHCVLWLTGKDVERASSSDLADLQGVPAATVAKIIPKLEKAGIVNSRDGIAGGYALAPSAQDITVLDVVDAIEGGKRLFDCKEVRRDSFLFGGEPPSWSAHGVCGIHAIMLRAENRMRTKLARTSLADLAIGVRHPPSFEARVASWLRDRGTSRDTVRMAAVKQAREGPREK